MNDTKDRIIERRKSREADSLKTWAALARKVASGKELGQKDLDQLDDAALLLAIENHEEVFADDVEELLRLETLDRESADCHARCEKLQEQAFAATAEVRRLREKVIPELERESAGARAKISGITHTRASADKIRQNPRLFPGS